MRAPAHPGPGGAASGRGWRSGGVSARPSGSPACPPLPAGPYPAALIDALNAEENPMLDRPHPTPDCPTLDERALARALSGQHFIGGRFVPPRSGRSFPVVNPATGKQIAEAAEGDGGDG